MTIDKYLEKLKVEYQNLEKVLIALSGGVDSCLASFLARKYLGKENAIAVISDSPSLKRKDFELAVNFCKKNDINYEVVNTSELENENYRLNPHNRCYFCKNELYKEVTQLAEKKYNDYKIINGNNFSDLGDYRPGLISADENEIFSPFITCKIDKSTIREIAKNFKLSVWDKPASPCLSSRFPYGEEISIEKLDRVESAEQLLNEYGFDEVRVRSFGDIAKIEVPKDKMNLLSNFYNELKSKITKIGFASVEIDDEGFISGKMNRVLNEL